MSTIIARNAAIGFDMSTLGLRGFLDDAGSLSRTETAIANTLPTGETITATGAFQYLGGKIVGGIVNSIVGTGAGGEIFSITGLELDAVVLSSWISSSGTQLDAWEIVTTGADTVDGSEHDDYFALTLSDDIVHARGGDDTLVGGEGSDILYGNLGNDSLVANGVGGWAAEENILFGGQGNDTVIGYTHEDALYGNLQDDSIDGGDGHDALYGGQGNDIMIGGLGNDTLFGNKGDDTMDGGHGANTYVFAGAFGDDRITGYVAVEDYIQTRGGITLVGIAESGGNTVITFSTGTVTLIGTASAGVEASINMLA